MSSRFSPSLQDMAVKGSHRLSDIPTAACTQLVALANQRHTPKEILLWYNVVLEYEHGAEEKPGALSTSDRTLVGRNSEKDPYATDQAIVAGGDIPFACHRCETRFKLERDLTRHIQEICEPWRKWQCPHCPRIFSRGYKYRGHHHREHGCDPSNCVLDASAAVLIAQNPIITCGFCTREFTAHVDDCFHHHDFARHLINHYKDGKIKSSHWIYPTPTASSCTLLAGDELDSATGPSPTFSPLTLPGDFGERSLGMDWGDAMLSGFGAHHCNAVGDDGVEEGPSNSFINPPDTGRSASATLVAPEDFEMIDETFHWDTTMLSADGYISHGPAEFADPSNHNYNDFLHSLSYPSSTQNLNSQSIPEIPQGAMTAVNTDATGHRLCCVNSGGFTHPSIHNSLMSSEVDLPQGYSEHLMPPYNPTPPVEYPNPRRHKRGISGSILNMLQNVSGFSPLL